MILLEKLAQTQRKSIFSIETLLLFRYCCLTWVELEFPTTLAVFEILTKLWDFNIMAMGKK